MRELWRDRYRVWLPLREERPRLLHRRGRHHQRHDSVDHHGTSTMDKPCTIISVEHLPGVVMLADLLTKAASRAIFTGLIKQLDDFHAL